MKNSAMRFVQEEKKVKAENTEWAGRKKRRRTKTFVSATPSAFFHALHESYLAASAASHTHLSLFCFSESLSPSHRCAREWGGEDP